MKIFRKLSLTALVSLMTIGAFTPYAHASNPSEKTNPVPAEEVDNGLDEGLIDGE
ncbi:hypothetical protein MM221_04760 [Salipaludibacillus sp. LMS25]|jgi:hypothetical protein|uniref:hypothetical protein n=1 Tax=Salipaludibacillus sp. LMS25 TaxID=2924031 RepID=UPI0020D014ED|nr:hypothetical protein [Salipaludibacillus sp. LMS25]UTR15874.1 hypothetical protein MM221_04760 [Salipaludibacillus sp. LMS25]